MKSTSTSISTSTSSTSSTSSSSTTTQDILNSGRANYSIFHAIGDVVVFLMIGYAVVVIVLGAYEAIIRHNEGVMENDRINHNIGREPN